MYYSLVFGYGGPRSNDAEGVEANEALSGALKIASAALDELSIKHKHQYCWPDGSLYEWISSDLPPETLKSQIDNVLEGQNVWLHTIEVDDPNSDPWKIGCKTLAEYMEDADD